MVSCRKGLDKQRIKGLGDWGLGEGACLKLSS